MYDSEILNLIEQSSLQNNNSHRKIMKLLHTNNVFQNFYLRLKKWDKEKSFDKNVEAKIVLEFLIELSKKHNDLEKELKKYINQYGIIKD